MLTPEKKGPLKWEIIFIISILLAFWLRNSHIGELNQNGVLFHHPVVDASEYHKEAESYAGGRHEWRVPIHGPLYPWLLGQVYRLTHGDPLSSRRFQMAMGFASVMLIFFGGRLIIGRRAAMLSGLLLAFYRPAFLFDAELYAEVITVFLTSAAALLITLMGRKGNWKIAIPLGLTLGLCAISRTNLIILLPLSMAIVIWQLTGPWAKKWGLGCLVLIIGALTIAPVTFLNYRTTGDFILIQGRTGHNLYQANHPGSDGTVDIRPGPAFQTFLRRPIVEANALGPKAESDYYLKKFRQFVFRHPVDFLLLLLKKAWNSLSPVEIPASYDPEGQQRVSWVARLPLPGFASILPFLIVGLLRYPGDRSSFLSLSLILLCVWASLLLGFAAGRYRYQCAGILCLLAGAGLNRLLHDLRVVKQNYRPLLVSLIFFFIGVWILLSAPRFENKQKIWRAELHNFLAGGYMRQKNFKMGLKEAAISIKINPNDPKPWYKLGVISSRGKDGQWGGAGAQLEMALEYFQKAIHLWPSFPEAHEARAGIFLYLGQPEKAVAELKKALEIWPFSKMATLRLAEAYRQLGQHENAETILKRFRETMKKF